jgi:hypothetical protein
MQIDIPEQTIRDVQAMLTRQGARADLPAFIDRTLKRAVFFDTVREVQRQNAGVDPTELQNLINEAVDATKMDPGADRP